MRVVFLVPRRKDGGLRDRLWAFCRAKWEREHPEWRVYEGHHNDGPFNRSAAINEAAHEAGDFDVGVVIDSDVIVDAYKVRDAVALAAETGKVIWAHTQWRGLTPAGTEAVLAGYEGDLDRYTEVLNPISWSCCFAIPRAVWNDLGGFDERFQGWGWEDMAWRCAVGMRHGTDRLPGAVVHLWHPRSEERAQVRQPNGMVSMTPHYLDNCRLGQRYMDAEAAGCHTCMGHLVEEARRHRRTHRHGVVVAALTNGRRDYLKRTIEAADRQLRGDIVRKVIWDDTGDPAYRAWLRTAFPGWYPIGFDQHVGYRKTMAGLWRYLSKRPGKFFFLLEEDFVLERPVDLDEMVQVLIQQPHLVQLSLLRQACYPNELAAGGIVQQWGEDRFTQVESNGCAWLEHRCYFTCNPMLARRELTLLPWPQVASSEAAYGATLKDDPKLRFGIWGRGETWCTHIGEVRTGDSY